MQNLFLHLSILFISSFTPIHSQAQEPAKDTKPSVERAFLFQDLYGGPFRPSLAQEHFFRFFDQEIEIMFGRDKGTFSRWKIERPLSVDTRIRAASTVADYWLKTSEEDDENPYELSYVAEGLFYDFFTFEGVCDERCRKLAEEITELEQLRDQTPENEEGAEELIEEIEAEISRRETDLGDGFEAQPPEMLEAYLDALINMRSMNRRTKPRVAIMKHYSLSSADQDPGYLYRWTRALGTYEYVGLKTFNTTVPDSVKIKAIDAIPTELTENYVSDSGSLVQIGRDLLARLIAVAEPELDLAERHLEWAETLRARASTEVSEAAALALEAIDLPEIAEIREKLQ